jgi:thiamine biosynthesis lipoprotein
MKRLEFHAMGSRMLAVVDSPSPAAGRLLQRVPGWFEEWEQALSRFRFDSELSRLNRSAGRPMPVSETLWEVFQAAREIELETGGLVRPTVLDALTRAGYDRSFELLPAAGAPAAAEGPDLPDLATAVGWEESTRSLCLPETVHLDFGGVAKGWAAEQAAGRLGRSGPALVDAGGDIAVSGPRPGGGAWPIGVRDPFQAEGHFETLRVERGGVATSGIDYHRWQQGGAWNHHIIDPRTGRPAATDLLTVTIVASDAIRAEAAAKAVLILGAAAGMDWLEADPGLAGLLVLQSGERRYSRHMQSYLWRKP